MTNIFMKQEKIFKALGDENRLKILVMLKSGELCACKILDDLHIGQPTLSHHMKVLTEAGLVIARKEGKWTHYSINQKTLAVLKEWLNKF
ncbi:MAG: metalloregulator ArsR/SmtB family transcription factor [Phascolarctobacterium sp.]|uniref:ArsR/SmtB family transcription factor n=1 Tax=Phascolarctobacterium sp. TaxID=2049039 RepID=UPI0025F84C19|nr:metalloregulator ArsR/SmtB family transcription factor [Phascolarctobacterium sp.]MCC8157811.1 metalloregulator ArsR/SmtB family transcription factor [Phascolarctobacterium sp.]